MNRPPLQHKTSWQPVSSWYNKAVGESGHYFHQHVVIPTTLRLLDLHPHDSLLDLACGQGVLERHIPKDIEYVGVDVAPSLVKFAQEHAEPGHRFITGDITQPLPIQKRDFTHAVVLLALQNIEHPHLALTQATDHLRQNGKLLLIINHPCFRIPRQSSWGIDERNKTQYRRVDRYLSPLSIPIAATPSKGQRSAVTWSYHLPISAYAELLRKAGFVIEIIEELGSDKVSVGTAAKMENRSCAEFPMFMAIVARKIGPPHPEHLYNASAMPVSR
ncbi:MAG: methyltransferase domain-containing protein [Candidatus Pacebacteria bacterium]|nr:methyltransferase domain-containing protein [Candidatus Paceibacterota bacterium]